MLSDNESSTEASALLADNTSLTAAVQGNRCTESAAPPGNEPQASREQTSRKTLAICPEFVCYEKPDGSRTVEATPELERAFDIARFGISAAKGVDIRLAQARALLELAEFAGGHEKDRDALLARLADAFGKPALEILNTPPVAMPISPERREALSRRRRDGDPPAASHVFSPAEQRKKAECAAEGLAAAIRNAFAASLTGSSPLPTSEAPNPTG